MQKLMQTEILRRRVEDLYTPSYFSTSWLRLKREGKAEDTEVNGRTIFRTFYRGETVDFYTMESAVTDYDIFTAPPPPPDPPAQKKNRKRKRSARAINKRFDNYDPLEKFDIRNYM